MEAGTRGGARCSVPADQIDARFFACGALDDIAVALVGLHPYDVWLNRLEANLPRSALGTDLVLRASASQEPISNVLLLAKSTGDPCPATDAGALASVSRAAAPRGRFAGIFAVLGAVVATVARRRRANRPRSGSSPRLR
jgi:hypothetical protein